MPLVAHAEKGNGLLQECQQRAVSGNERIKGLDIFGAAFYLLCDVSRVSRVKVAAPEHLVPNGLYNERLQDIRVFALGPQEPRFHCAGTSSIQS